LISGGYQGDEEEDGTHIYRMRLDGSDVQRMGLIYHYFGLSHDGRVMFWDERGAVNVANIDDTARNKIPLKSLPSHGFTLSPDNETLVWGTSKGLVYRDIASGPESSYMSGLQVSQAKFHPSGAYLGMTLHDDEFTRHIISAPARSNDWTMLVPNASTPAFSRDGNYLAFVDETNPRSDEKLVGVMDLATSQRAFYGPFLGPVNVQFTPDGTQIYFSALKAFTFPTGGNKHRILFRIKRSTGQIDELWPAGWGAGETHAVHHISMPGQ
jgi:Tol biopolymer transport system component